MIKLYYRNFNYFCDIIILFIFGLYRFVDETIHIIIIINVITVIIIIIMICII